MDHDFVFLVDAHPHEPGTTFLVSVVEKYNDVGTLAEKYPGYIYFYAKVEC